MSNEGNGCMDDSSGLFARLLFLSAEQVAPFGASGINELCSSFLSKIKNCCNS
jgi:hypothetical protein